MTAMAWTFISLASVYVIPFAVYLIGDAAWHRQNARKMQAEQERLLP